MPWVWPVWQDCHLPYTKDKHFSQDWASMTDRFHLVCHTSSSLDLLGLQQPLSQYVDELLEASTITQALLTPTHQGSAREGG